MTAPFDHTSVLLAESIAALKPRASGRYIDATLGAGGHAEKILELSRPDGRLLGLDADPTALKAAGKRLVGFGERVTLVHTYFDALADVARETGFAGVNGILFDLGVSSPQVDTDDRGFSFRADAPLDMRFDPGAKRSAAELVNTLSAEELQTVLREFGEERYARRIAQRIVAERRRHPIRTTAQLSEIVSRAKPAGSREAIHPATRVFQALRIAVNDELGRLRSVLPQTLEILGAAGRLVVISFHSLEDRIVKQFIAREARDCVCPPTFPVCVCGHRASLHAVTRKPIVASEAEVAANPRARSARMRVAERLAA